MKSFFNGILKTMAAPWKQWLLHVAVFCLVLALGGFLVVGLGLIPIKASSGHWGITEWFLQFSKRRSVDTYATGITAPPLDDPDLVVKGAGYYHVGCMPCHGKPRHQHPRVAQAMLPPPPYLPDRVDQWEDAELFSLVKHGIKFTGMPAWPTQQRDDEVWAVVAFLKKMPELDGDAYQQLALGDSKEEYSPSDSRRLRVEQQCGSCHGSTGQGRGDAFPRLAGQSADYLAISLVAYRSGERHSGMMEPMAARLTEEEIGNITSYYSELETRESKETNADASAIERGKVIAQSGVPESRIPACIHCHGPTEVTLNSGYPRLAGMSAKFLALQLDLFRSQQRGGTEYAHLMKPVAKNISPQQSRDVAAYYESLGTTSRRTGRD